MSDIETEKAILDAPTQLSDRKRSWFAAGGVIGAVLASTCCIAPLVLLTLGVSGAWISNLAALELYQPIFTGVALVSIGLGFRQVYFQAKPACKDDSCCARPESALITKSALWLSTALVILALTTNWWAPFFY
ncbi:mercuric transporter MerT family protein [Nitratireductor sp. GCM10026969]|uniref:mercuric transporter MerT family protein n=1 Tax=Nitratireductor sp. GCM10026969 TaxID=3252645 RepID=UPI003606D9B2